MIDCSWALLLLLPLWLSRSDNTWFMMEDQNAWSLIFPKLDIQTSPRSIGKLEAVPQKGDKLSVAKGIYSPKY